MKLGVNDLYQTLRKKATIHQVATMLATSKNALYYFQVVTTSTDNQSLADALAIITVTGHQYRWLAGGYDLEIGHF